MAGVAAPTVLLEKVVALIHLIEDVKRLLRSPFADEVRVGQVQVQAIRSIGVIADLQIDIVIRTGRPAAKRLRPVAVGKHVILMPKRSFI